MYLGNRLSFYYFCGMSSLEIHLQTMTKPTHQYQQSILIQALHSLWLQRNAAVNAFSGVAQGTNNYLCFVLFILYITRCPVYVRLSDFSYFLLTQHGGKAREGLQPNLSLVISLSLRISLRILSSLSLVLNY